MSVHKLNPVVTALGGKGIAAAITAASSSEVETRDKWVRAARAAYDAGTRGNMLRQKIKIGDAKPIANPHYDEAVYMALREFIIAGVNSSRPFQKQYFGTAPFGATGAEQIKTGPFLWSAMQIDGITKDQLRQIDDKGLKTMRGEIHSMVDGTLMGNLIKYLNGIEFPERKKAERAEKAAAPVNDGPLWDRLAALLVEVNSTCLSWKDEKGQTPKGLIELQEATLEAAARLGQVIKSLKA